MGVFSEEDWVPVRSEQGETGEANTRPKSAVEVLQSQCANLALTIAALTERIERLEGGGEGDTSEALHERRAALLAEAPFRASPHDRDTILTHGGRRIAAVYHADDRPILVQALNDAADAARRRQR